MAHSHDKTLLAKLGFSDRDKKHPRHDLACQYLAQSPVFAKLMQPFLGTGCEVVSAQLEHEYHITKGDRQYRTTIGFADLYSLNCVVQKRVTAPERILCPPTIADEDINKSLMDDPPPVDLPLARPPTPRSLGNSLAVPGYDSRAVRQERREALEKAAWDAWETATANASEVEFPVFAVMSVLIEVKIEKISVFDILRQMRLYSEYLGNLGRVSPLYHLPPEVVATDRYRQCPRYPGYDLSYERARECKCGNQFGKRFFGDPDSWRSSQQIVVTDFALSTDEVEALRSAGIAHARLGKGFEAYLEAQGAASAHDSPEV